MSSFSAVGGTVTSSGSYVIHTFNSSSRFTVIGTAPPMRVLLVGGGGGGGYPYGDPDNGGENGGSGVVIVSYSTYDLPPEPTPSGGLQGWVNAVDVVPPSIAGPSVRGVLVGA